MKNILLPALSFLVFALFHPSLAQAQCVPDTSISVAGVYPDTLPDGCQNQAYSAVVNFLFSLDTTISTPLGPVTVDFDSFVVASISGIPTGMNYTCNNSNCVYVTNPPNPTRGCVNLMGTPTDTTLANHTIDIVGNAWVTILGIPTPLSSTYKFDLKINDCGILSLEDGFGDNTSLNVFPNPLESGSVVEYSLKSAENVKVEIYNVHGKQLKLIFEGKQLAGKHSLPLFYESLPSGLFFVKLTLDQGKVVITQKVLSVN